MNVPTNGQLPGGPGGVELRPCGCRIQKVAAGTAVQFCAACAAANVGQALEVAGQALNALAQALSRDKDERKKHAERIEALERAVRELRERSNLSEQNDRSRL